MNYYQTDYGVVHWKPDKSDIVWLLHMYVGLVSSFSTALDFTLHNHVMGSSSHGWNHWSLIGNITVNWYFM